MSLFSEERVDGIAEKIYLELLKRGLISKDVKSFQAKAEIKKAYIKFYRINDEIEEIVRKKIKSMSKAPLEGSSEFKVLREKFFLEEWRKH